MKKTIPIIVMATLCLIFSVEAQSQTSNIKPLKIGDTIPDELWNLPLIVTNHSEKKGIITLDEYKNKLIILDFWNTYCSPCISSISHLDTLLNTFGNHLAVLPVTAEKNIKIKKFAETKGWHLPIITDDLSLEKYFPHYSVPHQIWINKGIVLAITGEEYGTYHNIKEILQGRSVQMLFKDDRNFDSKVSEFELNNRNTVSLMQSNITKAINFRGSGIKWSDTTLLAFNFPPIKLLEEAFFSDIPLSERFSRIELNVPDSIKTQFELQNLILEGNYESDKSKMALRERNLYCYSLLLSDGIIISRNEKRKIMQKDLVQFFSLKFGVVFKLEKRVKDGREIEVLVISKINQLL